MAKHAESLHMAIKHLTEEGSMARKIVLSAPGEDGFTTWWCLHNTFTRNLTARQGAVMTEFAATHSKPGKNPSETRTKLLEVDTAAKKWEEIMGKYPRTDAKVCLHWNYGWPHAFALNPIPGEEH